MNIAIVGYGIRGRKMAGLTKNHFSQHKISAVCDISEKALLNAQNDFPLILTYTDFDKMLQKETIDILFIETPAPFHTSFAIKAMKQNIHVLSDVPAVDNYNETIDLWNAHLVSNSLYMMQATTNMYGYIEYAENLQKKGMLGDPYYIETEYIHDLSELFGETPWRENYENIKYSTHCLGPSLRLMSEDLDTVTCFDTGSHIDKIKGRHDAMVAIFKTKSGAVLKLMVSFINNCPAHGQSYKFYFTDGYFERTSNTHGDETGETYFFSNKLHVDRKLHKLDIGERLPINMENLKIGNHGGANYELLRRFFHSIENNLPSPISLKESLKMTLPGIFAAESAKKNGTPVKIKYPWQG